MNYAQIAAAVYQHCTHFDPYLPPVSVDLARAWGDLFQKHRLNEHDLLAGVDLVYDQNGSGYRPLPADIIAAARSIRRDRAEREPEAESDARRDARQEANIRRLRALTEAFADTKTVDRALGHRRPDHNRWPLCTACGTNQLVVDEEVARGVCTPCVQATTPQQPETEAPEENRA